jgi:hypothetical protein
MSENILSLFEKACIRRKINLDKLAIFIRIMTGYLWRQYEIEV